MPAFRAHDGGKQSRRYGQRTIVLADEQPLHPKHENEGRRQHVDKVWIIVKQQSDKYYEEPQDSETTRSGRSPFALVPAGYQSEGREGQPDFDVTSVRVDEHA